ncbi:MAG: rhodanese-like domain-containing protein [Proteobacteria bacterium]|nr:rhodanese-like domain-containing protein [Pseudomonadota bacterium]
MSDILHRLPEFLGHHLILAVLLAGVLAALIGNEISQLFRGYRELTPAALTHLINRDNPLLVDLSAAPDFDKAHIAGARNVQMSQFDPENKDLAPVKDRPVAVYCRAGTTSSQAAAKLVKAGFKQVYWLGGGLAAWREANLPVAKGRSGA